MEWPTKLFVYQNARGAACQLDVRTARFTVMLPTIMARVSRSQELFLGMLIPPITRIKRARESGGTVFLLLVGFLVFMQILITSSCFRGSLCFCRKPS
jgi:hypothetical protein